MEPTPLVNPKDRFEVYRHFNGLAAEADSCCGRPRLPLVKTFLLEHVSSKTGTPVPASKILQRAGAQVRPIDDNFLEVKSYLPVRRQGDTPQVGTAGYLEVYDERFFAFYTSLRAEDGRRLVKKWVDDSPDLDSAWLSGQFLQHLWNEDVSKRGDDRYSRLVFRHESIFDMPDCEAVADCAADDTGHGAPGEDAPGEESANGDEAEWERRKARFEMGDRIREINKRLDKLQAAYPPLHALYSLRIPSKTCRGSHDLYQGGQLTNRSDTFEDHRAMARYIWRLYSALLTRTEDAAWFTGPQAGVSTFKGVPLIVRFGEPLPLAVFDRWMSQAFHKRNPFRLWGEPIRLGPGKIHVYGADRHLWQPINLEVTTDRVVAILPKGTCGNTFHRLVTNIQQYVCPQIDAWVGEKPFDQLLGEAGFRDVAALDD